MDREPVSIEELKQKTDEFLEWVEERKMKGFMGREVENFRKILGESLQRDSFGETVEHVKGRIRNWIAEWWSPSIIGKKYEKHLNRTDRAKVIREFPELLSRYLDTLSSVDQYELDESERVVFEEIRERIRVSIDTLEFKADESKEAPMKERKKRRTKPPRANR